MTQNSELVFVTINYNLCQDRLKYILLEYTCAVFAYSMDWQRIKNGTVFKVTYSIWE